MTAFRADHIGSLLRPEPLLEARRRRDAGTISDGELRTVEDEAIAAAVKGQQDAGVDVITDGEFRRQDFRTGFVEAVDGLELRSWDMPWHSSEGVTKLRSHTWVATGRLRPRSRLAAGEAAALVGLDRLALSPQCGFASVAEGGNHLTEDEQFAKLRLVADTARAVWGEAGR